MKKLMMLAAVAIGVAQAWATTERAAIGVACGYVPEPKPIKTSVEVAALYYPGTPQMSEWEIVERARPGIKPLLGWYDESNPEVIDWQIKWAVEHGISTFFVDWYWWNKHGGAIRLHWVNNYYKAKYRKYLKWAMMWANHNEPGAHSTADQRRVTQYWIDNYFKTPEYYTIDGKPVVVVWDTGNLDRDFIAEAAANGETLASGEGVKRAFALSEEMARAAGLKGIYWMCMYHGKQYFPEKIAFAKEIGCKGQMIYNFDSLAYHLAPEARKADDTERRFNYDLVMAAVPKWWELTSRDPAFPLWPMIPTGWDDTPRSYQNARAIVERTPEPTGEEVGKLYWGTPEQPIHDLACVVSERNTATTSVKVDGEWHEYTIDLAGCANWRSEVNELWFDAGCVPNAETLIDYIRLVSRE